MATDCEYIIPDQLRTHCNLLGTCIGHADRLSLSATSVVYKGIEISSRLWNESQEIARIKRDGSNFFLSISGGRNRTNSASSSSASASASSSPVRQQLSPPITPMANPHSNYQSISPSPLLSSSSSSSSSFSAVVLNPPTGNITADSPHQEHSLDRSTKSSNSSSDSSSNSSSSSSSISAASCVAALRVSPTSKGSSSSSSNSSGSALSVEGLLATVADGTYPKASHVVYEWIPFVACFIVIYAV